MARVITFSRVFPKYHPKAGQPTFFVEKLWTDLFWQNIIDNRNMDEPLLEEEIKNFYTKTFEGKSHTIRSGNRWKVGDWFSPRVWSDKPYASKQILLTPLIQVKKTFSFELKASTFLDESKVFINGKKINSSTFIELATNDGLAAMDLLEWFGDGHAMSTKRKDFSGQIICWNSKIQY